MWNVSFLLVVAVLYLGSQLQPQLQAPSGKQPATTSAHAAPDRFKGRPAPKFELKLVNGNGKTLKLSDLEGKGVVVNFWATWCEPCKIEMPWLIRLQKKYGAHGLQIVGVAMDSSTEKAVFNFTHKMRVNYPVVLGTDNVAAQYGGVAGLPLLFFIDRSGTIVQHETGLVSESTIENNIKECLRQAGTPSTGR